MNLDSENRQINNVLLDNIGTVRLLNWMGNDKDVIERARICYNSFAKSTPDKDKKLLRQLITSDLIHGTPLRAINMIFLIKLPLFVMRQWTRHIIANDYEILEFSSIGHNTFDWGGAYDEMSGRYVDFSNEPEFYNPASLHKFTITQSMLWTSVQNDMLKRYKSLRDDRIPKELSRSFIPASIYTYVNWSVNIQGFITWYEARKKGSGAQLEHVQYAEAVKILIGTFVSEQIIQNMEDRFND